MTTTDSRSAQWLKSNLAAIGSAAVLTVYATGWARTKAAADLLEEQSARRLPPRRPAARVSMGQVDGSRMPRAAAGDDGPSPEQIAQAAASSAPADVADPSQTEPRGGSAAGSPSAADVATAAGNAASNTPGDANNDRTTAVRSTPAPSASALQSVRSAPLPAASVMSSTVEPSQIVASVAPAPSVAPIKAAPAPTVAAPVKSVAAGSTSTTKPTSANTGVVVPNSSDTRPPERELATDAVATVPASAGATKADPNAPRGYKDGVYSGWGSSRHGDIEAYVEIKNGRIKSTFISECLTQYSCSWIAKLPGWVVEAQSAETDYISGATQSSNAFYYAVVAALNKAR